MYRRGVDRIFFAGTPLEEIVKYLKTAYCDVVQLPYGFEFAGADQFLSRQLRWLKAAAAADPRCPSGFSGHTNRAAWQR